MKFLAIFTLNRVHFVLLLSILLGLATSTNICAQGQGGIGVVVIDAGHGGTKYPGATYGGYMEKDINLQIALKLGALLKEQMPELKVIYTRTTDKQFSSELNADLQARADIANRAEADLFISIHANAARSTAAYGFETLVMGEGEKETRLNEGALYANNREELIDMSDERTAAIVRAYIQNLQFTYGEYSEAMARLMQRNYSVKGYHDRGVKPRPLKVLYATDMPSVLTEVGFMSNPADLKRMTSKSGQAEIAQAMCDAVKEYSKHVEKLRLGEQKSLQTAQLSQPETVASSQSSESKLQSGFTIQLMASPEKVELDSERFKGYKGRVREYTASGRYCYKYCYGEFKSRAEAQNELTKVRESVKDAFIVRFEGSRIK